MANWSHAMCPDCWFRENPDREPVVLREEFRGGEEGCCFCGARTRAGIWVRRSRDELPLCAGHDDARDAETAAEEMARKEAGWLYRIFQGRGGRMRLRELHRMPGWAGTGDGFALELENADGVRCSVFVIPDRPDDDEGKEGLSGSVPE